MLARFLLLAVPTTMAWIRSADLAIASQPALSVVRVRQGVVRVGEGNTRAKLPADSTSKISSMIIMRGGNSESQTDSLAVQATRAILGFLDRRYFLAGAAFAVALAAIAPSIGCTGGPLRPELTIGWGATCGIFFLSGLTLPTSELASAAFRVREHVAIQSFNLGCMAHATPCGCNATPSPV